jgi:hypothetical protein
LENNTSSEANRLRKEQFLEDLQFLKYSSDRNRGIEPRIIRRKYGTQGNFFLDLENRKTQLYISENYFISFGGRGFNIMSRHTRELD